MFFERRALRGQSWIASVSFLKTPRTAARRVDKSVEPGAEGKELSPARSHSLVAGLETGVSRGASPVPERWRPSLPSRLGAADGIKPR